MATQTIRIPIKAWYGDEEMELNFIRDTDRREVDFVVMKNQEPVFCVECKTGDKFHSHDSEQVLIVTSGRGYIATEAEKIEITPGDVVLIPAGEKHWHGATEDSDFSHIYLSQLGSELTQLED